MVVPVVLCLAHLGFGANSLAASLWLTALMGIALCVALAGPWRRGLHDVSPIWPLAGLFGLTIGLALWSLTPWSAGGAHPVWAWAGVSPGSLTVDRSGTWVEIVKLLGLGAVFVVGALQGVRKDRATATVEGIVWVGGVWSAISLLMFLSGTQVAQGGRLTGGFLSGNSAATVFGMLTVLALALFLKEWRRSMGARSSDRLTELSGPIVCLALSAVCLLLTASRMGVVATLAALVVLLVWELLAEPKGRLSIAVAGAVLLVVGGVLFLAGNTLIWTRVAGIDADVDVRGEIFGAHWEAFLASPLFGYGLGSFDAINQQIMTAGNARELWSIGAVHNVYLQWLQEAGMIGAAAMFALIGAVSIAALVRSVGRGRGLQHGLVCAGLVVLVHGLSDYALQAPSIAAFWAFLLGLQFAFGEGRG